jgi:D-amino-acid dehydrogenase
MRSERSALVIGGGIIGVTSAFALAQEGWQVKLIERESNVAMGASWGNGRQLSYSHTNALAAPSLLLQIPALLLGQNDAFRLKLSSDPGFLTWCLRLLANCTSSANRRNTLEALALAQKSRSAMKKLLEHHPIKFDRQRVGKLVLISGDGELRAAQRTIELRRHGGVRQALLSADEMIALEPALDCIKDRLAGALYSPDDETGDCHLFARRLLEVGQKEFGLSFVSKARIERLGASKTKPIAILETGETLESNLIVVATGYGCNDLLIPLGHRLPVLPMKGYSFTAPLGNSAPKVSITDAKRRIVFTNLGDRMLVAGIAEMGRVDSTLDPSRLENMILAAQAALPEAAIYSEADGGWTGMRPMTPNSRPIIRMLEPGIAVNVGHGMLGWTLAMGSAERLCEVVRGST